MSILFAFVVAVRLLYYGWVLCFLLFTRKANRNGIAPNAASAPPVSVIICARNEAQNLEKNLPLVLEQDYPCFEVVVVNHASTDNTGAVLKEFQKKHAHLKVVAILASENLETGGKRQALQKGIEAASFNHLLLTDADCFPASKQWVKLMAQQFAGGKEIVLGFGPYLTGTGMLNAFVQYETLHTALQYFSFAFAGLPYMGVGRNLAYTKALFYASGGFNGQMHLASGDDDLLVNRAANFSNTAIQIKPDSFCYSQAPTRFKDWYRQKARHTGAGKYYHPLHVFLLFILSVCHFVFYGMLIVTWFVPNAGNLTLLFWLPAFVLHWVVFMMAGALFKTKKMAAAPLFDVVFMMYYLAFTPFALTTKKVKWKH